jgi:hypothetical protein
MALSMSAWTLAMVMTVSSDTVDGEPMHLFLGGRTQVVASAAIAGALRRLESPSCQRVLTDFADESGRSLADSLAATGLTLPVYVSRLYAVEGDRERGCANAGTRAFTAPGSHVIYLCSAHFDSLSERIVSAQMTIIHEILHTLGLGENPPSSDQITQQVIARCRAFP